MSKIENSFDDSAIREKLLLNHYEIIINNRNWDMEDQININIEKLKKENLSTNQSLIRSTKFINEIFYNFIFLFNSLMMIKLNEEDTQESDNIQQIIKILKSIEDKIKTNKLYRIRISKILSDIKKIL